MPGPAFEEIVAAREFIAPYLPKTPLIRVNALCELLDCDYYAKLENLQPTGAFKVRGGVNLVGTASDDERRRGLVAASTGNHGQSVSYAARLFGVRARIVVPEAVVQATPNSDAVPPSIGLVASSIGSETVSSPVGTLAVKRFHFTRFELASV